MTLNGKAGILTVTEIFAPRQNAPLTFTDSDIPDGSQVGLKAVIVAGRDHTASEQYIYNKESSKMAFYKVSGTTYINDKLELISCK